MDEKKMSRILLIEDNLSSARLAMKILRRGGHDVYLAENGEDGFTMALEIVPDIILVDLGLPDVDGQTLVALLRQQPLLVDKPIVAVTAWPPDSATQMAKAYGCDGVITKPIESRTFADKVFSFLDKEPT
jgi:two-component system cell cycle response regulator DivK